MLRILTLPSLVLPVLSGLSGACWLLPGVLPLLLLLADATAVAVWPLEGRGAGDGERLRDAALLKKEIVSSHKDGRFVTQDRNEYFEGR